MGTKRDVSPILRKMLDLDVKLTNNIIGAIIKRAGPMRHYNTTLKGLEISGNGLVWLGSCTAAVFISSSIYLRHLIVNLFIALLFDLLVVAVVKSIVRRRRPVPLNSDSFTVQSIDKFSFPSGHATRAAMVAVIFSTQYELGLLAEVPLYIWFMSVCSSRLLLRRHYLLDIVAGIVIGWLEALTLIFTGLWLSVDTANSIVAYFLDETYTGASYDV